MHPEARWELLPSRGPHLLPGGPWWGAQQQDTGLGPIRETDKHHPTSPTATAFGLLPPHTHTRAHPRLPGKLLVWHKCLLPQGAMGPVFASIDVKICQEFHSLLVKIHPQSVLLPSPGTPQSSVTSLASQWAPPASIARDSLEKEHCPALEGLPQGAPLRGPSPGLPGGSPWCQPWPGGPLVGPSDSWLGLISSLLPSYPNPLLS